jgi:hypothetical protein
MNHLELTRLKTEIRKRLLDIKKEIRNRIGSVKELEGYKKQLEQKLAEVEALL